MRFFVKSLAAFFLFYSTSAWALANPASVYCAKVGGRLLLQKRGDGGQFGVCLFEDNRQCEEWALFRGECPVGGVKVTGYTSPAQIYCAIQGGKTVAVDSSKEDETPCVFSSGAQCGLTQLFNGQCQK